MTIARKFLSVFFSITFVFNTLQAVNKEQAQAVIKKALSITGHIETQILNGGLTSASIFLITTKNKSYVIRFFPHKIMKSRQHEIDSLKIASHEGYGPKIYYADADEGFVIMDFLPDSSSTIQQETPSHTLTSLAELLRAIHHGSKFNHSNNYFKNVDKRLKFLQTFKPKDIHINTIEHILKVLHHTLSPYLEKTPCHLDLHPGNLIFVHNTFKAIDFESAAQDDPYFDVATVAIFFCTTPIEEKILLSAYLRRMPTAIEQAKLYLMEQFILLAYGVCFLSTMPSQLINYKRLNTPSYTDLINKKPFKNFDLKIQQNKLILSKVFINEVITRAQSNEFYRTIKILN